MSGRCGQELCENWSGDGDVCICALFDIEARWEEVPLPADSWLGADPDGPTFHDEWGDL